MSTGTIRLALLSDAAPIADVTLASWEAAYRGLMPDDLLDEFTRERRIELWRERWTEPPPERRAWVAEEGGTVVGYVSTGETDTEGEDPEHVAEVHSLYVHPRAWRGGLGSRLTAHALDDAFARGAREVRLWCLTVNAVGRAFYERFGFRVVVPEDERSLLGHALVHTRYALERARHGAEVG
jgi:ribosomal protein S18 acetylase RimI-like enzyme